MRLLTVCACACGLLCALLCGLVWAGLHDAWAAGRGPKGRERR